jgi:hypothetical protein
MAIARDRGCAVLRRSCRAEAGHVEASESHRGEARGPVVLTCRLDGGRISGCKLRDGYTLDDAMQAIYEIQMRR